MSDKPDLTEREEWLVKSAYLAGFSAAYNRAGAMVGDWIQLNRRQLARDAPDPKEEKSAFDQAVQRLLRSK